jgi:transcription elongation GreA/GreB family factor
MGQLDTRSRLVAIQNVRQYVLRLEQTLPSVTASEREQIIKQLVAYDEAIDALEHADASSARLSGVS